MITRLNKNNKKNYPWLLELLQFNFDYDFYFTENNSRYYITDEITLKKLFRSSDDIYVTEKDGDYSGIILLWRSKSGMTNRYYVKLVAINTEVAKNLLTALVWNIDKEVFVKIRKNSKFLKVFKSKGFKFKGGRGVQILLKRKRYKSNKEKVIKEENK